MVDAAVTAAEPTSSSDDEQAAEVGSHPLPDMFGAQVRQAPAVRLACGTQPAPGQLLPAFGRCYKQKPMRSARHQPGTLAVWCAHRS